MGGAGPLISDQWMGAVNGLFSVLYGSVLRGFLCIYELRLLSFDDVLNSKTKSLANSFSGAEAPNICMAKIVPVFPTYLPHPNVIAKSRHTSRPASQLKQGRVAVVSLP